MRESGSVAVKYMYVHVCEQHMRPQKRRHNTVTQYDIGDNSKNELPQMWTQTHDTLFSRRVLYHLSYRGSSDGKGLNHKYMYTHNKLRLDTRSPSNTVCVYKQDVDSTLARI